MKILYGVQATGNGHITRARVMAPALSKAGVEVDYLFSGRDPEKLFNMEPFGDYRCLQGLTFHMDGSRVDKWKTLTQNRPIQLIKDIRALNLDEYDLVVTDFEPVTAWAAKLKGKPCVGIAHQYAFLSALPDKQINFLSAAQINMFAPAKTAVGLHWHHFDQAIFPPLIQAPLFEPSLESKKIVVYLPHDEVGDLERVLSRQSFYDFYIYSGIEHAVDRGNIHVRPFSRQGFHKDLASCEGVICNSGFGLLSEAMQYGKKILTLPQKGQMEQESNAEVLAYLGLGVVVSDLVQPELGDWLKMPVPESKVFPDLASVLANWIAAGCSEPVEQLSKEVWQQCRVFEQLPVA